MGSPRGDVRRTGAVLHTFPAPAAPHRAFTAVDGSYVVLVTDAAIELFTPTGTLIRRVLAADLLTPGALPYTDGVFVGRPGELWMGFAGPLENRFEIIPKSGAARAVGPLPGGLDGFSDDGKLAVWHDFSGPTPVTSVREIDGKQRGVGLTGTVVGNYAVGTDGYTVTIESLAGPTAARVATYPKLVRRTRRAPMEKSPGPAQRATGSRPGVRCEPLSGDRSLPSRRGDGRRTRRLCRAKGGFPARREALAVGA